MGNGEYSRCHLLLSWLPTAVNVQVSDTTMMGNDLLPVSKILNI